MKLSIREISAMIQAKRVIDDPRFVEGVEFDSRKITKGGLFVPLAGGRDGHDFVQQAIENGAIATLWAKPLKRAPENIAVIPVDDPLMAMQRLAINYLHKVKPDVVAITGSNGKTTTKDMTDAVLSQKFHTYKTQGNYNNNIGLPYTILHMPEETEKLVLEMGMDHAGEIELLSTIANPDVAAITMIGEAHIENLGSREEIAKAKMEITRHLAEDGLLLVPAHEPLLLPLVKKLTQTVTTFGIDDGVIAGRILEEKVNETAFEIHGNTFKIPVIGSYNVQNALIAYGVGSWFGLTPQEIRKGLASFQLTKNRTQWLNAANGADILSDVYNANPTAMALVLETFSGIKQPAGKKIVVLADMLALGNDSPHMHAAMAEHIDGTKVAEVFLYGSEMAALDKALAKQQPDLEVHYFPNGKMTELTRAIKDTLEPDDLVLLKGSNGMELDKLVNALKEDGEF